MIVLLQHHHRVAVTAVFSNLNNCNMSPTRIIRQFFHENEISPLVHKTGNGSAQNRSGGGATHSVFVKGSTAGCSILCDAKRKQPFIPSQAVIHYIGEFSCAQRSQKAYHLHTGRPVPIQLRHGKRRSGAFIRSQRAFYLKSSKPSRQAALHCAKAATLVLRR